MLALFNNYVDADVNNFCNGGFQHRSRYGRRYDSIRPRRCEVVPSRYVSYGSGFPGYGYNSRTVDDLYNQMVPGHMYREPLAQHHRYVYRPITKPKLSTRQGDENYYVQIIDKQIADKEVSVDYLKRENTLAVAITQSTGKFTAKLPFTEKVNYKGITANYISNGVTITIPKVQEARYFTISIPQLYESFFNDFHQEEQDEEQEEQDEQGIAQKNEFEGYEQKDQLEDSDSADDSESDNDTEVPVYVNVNSPVEESSKFKNVPVIHEDDGEITPDEESESEDDNKKAVDSPNVKPIKVHRVTLEDVEDEQGYLSI
jgi:hypothetical protein